MLLYKDGNIMQVLEGAEEKVSALIEKLRLDPCHHAIQLLLQNQVNDRPFEQWAMAFKKVDAGALHNLDGLSHFLGHDVAAETFQSNPGKAYRGFAR
jgi:Sensors of blue-light using FAD